METKMNLRVLVFGATGMLGSTLFRVFSADGGLKTFGTIREPQCKAYSAPRFRETIISDIYPDSERGLIKSFSIAKPDVVVNCVGIIKQRDNADDHLENLAINAGLPHRLAEYSSLVGARLVHFSTDCVFSGKDGQYREGDFPDAYDLYGRTKCLGEVDYEHAVTLRTSIIGHELIGAKSLVDWFLGQSGNVKGYRKAIFSGLPTIELARVVRELVIPNPNLRGLYHVSADAISKYDLLRLVAETYGKNIAITPDDEVEINRALNSDRFRIATGYAPKTWPELILDMYNDYQRAGGGD